MEYGSHILEDETQKTERGAKRRRIMELQDGEKEGTSQTMGGGVPSDIKDIVSLLDTGQHTIHGKPLFPKILGGPSSWDSVEAMIHYVNRPSHPGSYEIQMIYACWYGMMYPPEMRKRYILKRLKVMEPYCKGKRASKILESLRDLAEKDENTMIPITRYGYVVGYRLRYHSIEMRM